MQEIVTLVGSLGFPVAVTLYLLVERRTTYRELTVSIYKLKDTVAELAAYLRGRGAP